MCGFFELLIKLNLAYPRLGRPPAFAGSLAASLTDCRVRAFDGDRLPGLCALALMLPLVSGAATLIV